jgi:hypothetical protein
MGRGSFPRVEASSCLKRLLKVGSVVEETKEEKEMSWATLLTA